MKKNEIDYGDELYTLARKARYQNNDLDMYKFYMAQLGVLTSIRDAYEESHIITTIAKAIVGAFFSKLDVDVLIEEIKKANQERWEENSEKEEKNIFLD